MGDIITLVSGTLVLFTSVGSFIYCLPRDGQAYRFADTEWEPYIGVAFCSGIGISFTMILSSMLNLFGA